MFRCPWAQVVDDDYEHLFFVFQMFEDWRALGILPYGVERIEDAPAWLVDSFRVCANVDRIATLKQQMLIQSQMMTAGLAGRIA